MKNCWNWLATVFNNELFSPTVTTHHRSCESCIHVDVLAVHRRSPHATSPVEDAQYSTDVLDVLVNSSSPQRYHEQLVPLQYSSALKHRSPLGRSATTTSPMSLPDLFDAPLPSTLVMNHSSDDYNPATPTAASSTSLRMSPPSVSSSRVHAATQHLTLSDLERIQQELVLLSEKLKVTTPSI